MSPADVIQIKKRPTATSGSRALTHACAINVSYPTRTNGRGSIDVPEMRVGAATLPLLVSLIAQLRPGARTRMWDEIGTPVDFDYIDGLPRETTLMMLSVRTNLAFEARELARRLQGMGFAVVMGGPHVSACLDEVTTYANAAVHGEAEVHMADVLSAFEAGAFHARTLPGLAFKSSAAFDLTRSPIPARWLYRHSRSYMHPGVLEFGRGCQFRCSFCASTNLYTDVIRHKSVGQVIAEIATLPEHPGGFRAWFFGDDNFASSHPRAIALANAIGAHYPKARWGTAMTIASARDPVLLDALAAGGMRYVFIGFDSIVQESLKETHKTIAASSQFTPLVGELKKRGIFVVAALVFGFDHDRPGVFAQTLDWALQSGVDVLNLNVLRPYPSSPLYGELRRDARLLHDPWWMQSFDTRLSMVHGLTANVSGVMTTFQPRHMSPRDLAEGTLWVGQQFYSARRSVPRLIRNAQSFPTMVVDALTSFFYAREYRSFVPVSAPLERRPGAPGAVAEGRGDTGAPERAGGRDEAPPPPPGAVT
jgi:radical SAM superfamily enzyme YgiQ (UPF0313 family)